MRKRNIKKQIWLDTKEDELLKRKSKEAGLSEAEFVRSLIKGYKIKAQPTEEIKLFQRDLYGIANNINQIAKVANSRYSVSHDNEVLMAITKYKVIKKNLEAVINYAMNGEKTENGILVSTINCLPETAYSQMMLTKKAFHKEDGRLGYHIIQSFKGKEISPEKCNQIGKEFAKQLWGDKYQVLVCTHTNKDNIHNHIILNSVSFIDGSKYHNSNVDIALMKQTNDDICFKYRLNVLETAKANKGKDIAKSRIKNYNLNSGKMELIKSDIDDAIKQATKYQEFINILSFKGYYIKKSNSIYLFLLHTIIEIYDYQEHLEKIILLIILKLEFIKVSYMIDI